MNNEPLPTFKRSHINSLPENVRIIADALHEADVIEIVDDTTGVAG